MLRFYIFLILLFMFGSAAHAQNTPAAPATITGASASNYTRADTVKAVQNLFARRRAGGWFNATSKVTIAAGVSAVALLLLESNPIGLGVVGTSIGVGIGKLVRFSSKKEAALISSYQAGTPLPQPIRKRLRKKHFKQAGKDQELSTLDSRKK